MGPIQIHRDMQNFLYDVICSLFIYYKLMFTYKYCELNKKNKNKV